MGERKIAGFFKQLLILQWKNWILFKRNIVGTLGECLIAIIFVLIIIMIRVFIDPTLYSTESNTEYGVLTKFNQSRGRYLVMYYPNNAYINGLVTNAFTLIKTDVPSTNVTSRKEKTLRKKIFAFKNYFSYSL